MRSKRFREHAEHGDQFDDASAEYAALDDEGAAYDEGYAEGGHRRGARASYDDYEDYDDSAQFDRHLDEPFDDATGHGRALAMRDDQEHLPALASDVAPDGPVVPVIISGSGVSMGTPFIKRRERPLTMRVAILTLTLCILVTGAFAVTPLTTSAASGPGSSFQALAGAIVFRQASNYFWYTAQWGDSPESIARKFGVQVGGIYELNKLLAGQEITVGMAYKIPTDKGYGVDYKPASFLEGSRGYGTTTYGGSPWSSMAGLPAPETTCGTDGHGSYLGYQLQTPDPSAAWVRGFTYFHNGVDLAANDGNPLRAAQAGEVIWAGWDVGGLGWSVKINHCNHVATVYGHMQRLNVHVHDVVDKGSIVGYQGSTGWSTGSHLHYMVEWDNVPVDPLAFYSNIYTLTHIVN